MRGNIFERLNANDNNFPISGTIDSVFFKGVFPDPKTLAKRCAAVN